MIVIYLNALFMAATRDRMRKKCSPLSAIELSPNTRIIFNKLNVLTVNKKQMTHMRTQQFFTVIIGFLFLSAFKSDKPTYMLFNSKGKLISYERMIKKLAEADVILFGEYHNNPIAH